jgi:hypothetical protein
MNSFWAASRLSDLYETAAQSAISSRAVPASWATNGAKNSDGRALDAERICEMGQGTATGQRRVHDTCDRCAAPQRRLERLRGTRTRGNSHAPCCRRPPRSCSPTAAQTRRTARPCPPAARAPPPRGTLASSPLPAGGQGTGRAPGGAPQPLRAPRCTKERVRPGKQELSVKGWAPAACDRTENSAMMRGNSSNKPGACIQRLQHLYISFKALHISRLCTQNYAVFKRFPCTEVAQTGRRSVTTAADTATSPLHPSMGKNWMRAGDTPSFSSTGAYAGQKPATCFSLAIRTAQGSRLTCNSRFLCGWQFSGRLGWKLCHCQLHTRQQPRRPLVLTRCDCPIPRRRVCSAVQP